ncbi:MAG: L-2-hydroxyglutarate oxidase [Verrucomicrobia bacterium]|nr:L-2-hydroxyglutarate oxidase [Verrucomicrobiota bacterium]
MNRFDLAVVGGGIVGLAAAWTFARRHPGGKVLVLEKESRLASHQTGRNSGVIHSGIYYKPGSRKALHCRAGREALIQFCQEHRIAHDLCGKLIVATDPQELPRMDTLFERGRANGVRCEKVGPERIRELEPHCAGIAAIQVHDAGIVDYPGVCETLARLIRGAGGSVETGAHVESLEAREDGVVLRAGDQEWTASLGVNCGGLHSDRLARLAGANAQSQIIPFRGEYFEIRPGRTHLCRNLIYPVPDPQFPFLGVHFTRMIEGGLECGPNAVLAFGRESYRFSDVNWGDTWEMLTFPGFRKLAAKHWRMGMGEFHRCLSKAAFVKALQRLIPEVGAEDLTPIPAGIRAQAVRPDGALVDDFELIRDRRMVHVINAPSPAATACLQIGSAVVDFLSGESSIT